MLLWTLTAAVLNVLVVRHAAFGGHVMQWRTVLCTRRDLSRGVVFPAKCAYGDGSDATLLSMMDDDERGEAVCIFRHRDYTVHRCMWPIGVREGQKVCVLRSLRRWLADKNVTLAVNSTRVTRSDAHAWGVVTAGE